MGTASLCHYQNVRESDAAPVGMSRLVQWNQSYTINFDTLVDTNGGYYIDVPNDKGITNIATCGLGLSQRVYIYWCISINYSYHFYIAWGGNQSTSEYYGIYLNTKGCIGLNHATNIDFFSTQHKKLFIDYNSVRGTYQVTDGIWKDGGIMLYRPSDNSSNVLISLYGSTSGTGTNVVHGVPYIFRDFQPTGLRTQYDNAGRAYGSYTINFFATLFIDK